MLFSSMKFMRIIFFLVVKNGCSGNKILYTKSATYIENHLMRVSKPYSDIYELFFLVYLVFWMENADSNMHHQQL